MSSMEKYEFEIDDDAPLAVALKLHKRRKLKLQKREIEEASVDTGINVDVEIEAPLEIIADVENEAHPKINVSVFDYSIQNHISDLRTMLKLCGDHHSPEFSEAEIQRFSSSITFLKEWKDFHYKPKTIRFACQNGSMNGKDVIGEISLPQFSAASVPKDLDDMKSVSSKPSEDFVLYAGGSVWALDWCPRANEESGSGLKMEFVAVAAHPPGSSYHKIGSALTGRGVIQIWCMLDIAMEENNSSQGRIKQKRCCKKRQTDDSDPAAPKRPRGRPKKDRTNDTLDNIKSGNQVVEIASKYTHDGVTPTKSEDGIQTDGVNPSAARKPRGRPRRNSRIEAIDNVNRDTSLVEPLAIQYPEDAQSLLPIDASPICNQGVTSAESVNAPSQVKENQKGTPKKGLKESAKPQMPKKKGKKTSGNDSSNHIESSSQCIQPLESEYVTVTDAGNNPELTSRLTESKSVSNHLKLKRLKDKAMTGERGDVHNLVQDGNRKLTSLHSETCTTYDPGSIRSRGHVNAISRRDVNTLSNSTPPDVPLPRMMLCLAHNGKVVWDLKWRPSNSHDKLRLGYLAVVLGSGAIEVWEVPFPYAVEVIYSSSPQLECTDPRFIKLEPVFRCSKLNCGDMQSIPLTVEWSTSSPHDMVVAGCHDGVVALWKFSPAVSCKETKPLLRFNADTVPIRTLAWAPAESNCEGSNVIVTGGNKGLKFWDIRDPFHPLWAFNPIQMNILSLDWLPDPRCVVVSFDDGTLRVLTLMKAANDGPVTGKPFSGTPQQGFSSYFCSSSAIWDVHVSRKTGMVAYCGVDGNALLFQLTKRAVERDPLRNRAPHFLCGSLMEEESELTVITPQSNIPFPMKKSLNEWGDAPRTKRGFLSVSNQKKRAKEEMGKSKISDESPLALCYHNDLGGGSDTDPLTPQKTKQAHKSATKRTSKPDETTLICTNENQETPQNVADQDHVVDEIDSFPPKSIAIHRVRWNMNKGSERWLCYGGASGIIRFQKVDISIA